MSDEGWLERARELYDRATFGGDADAVAVADRELDAVEADLALARGRLLHVRFLAGQEEDPRELELMDRAAELYHQLGDVRGEAESLFWAGTYHQVVRGDQQAARPLLERSYALASQAGDKLTLSYAIRHLGFAEMAAGNSGAAREHLAESLRLRREIGFMPGVAAALLALAELAAESGDREAAQPLLDEAVSVAEASDAQRVLHWIAEARAKM
jgi:tetratricopeptide (TPR) repeat protein